MGAQLKSRFVPGEVWEYRAREVDSGSTFRVLLVEPDTDGDLIVHIEVRAITFVKPDGSPYKTNMGHLPIAEKFLVQSATRRIAGPEPVVVPKGYGIWRNSWVKQEAGVFGVPLAKAIEFVAETAKQ
jgi:hypothetical protein